MDPIKGELLVDDQQQVPKYKLLGGENLILSAELEPEGDWQPENIPLDIMFEDDHIIVINKPANFVVHPAAGNYSGTLRKCAVTPLPSAVIGSTGGNRTPLRQRHHWADGCS